MKKIVFICLISSLIFALCSCYDTLPIRVPDDFIPGDASDLNSEREHVNLIKTGGILYYDTGRFNDMEGRCGVSDGDFTKGAEEFEVPYNDGESNFSVNKNSFQIGTEENTIEVEFSDAWRIFKKVPDEIFSKNYKYCYCVRGRSQNADADSNFIVFANDETTTFKDAEYILIGSDTGEMKDIGVILAD